MTVTIHLPQPVEQAYLAAAHAQGVSIDTLVSDVLISHLPVPEKAPRPGSGAPRFVEENGIPVLHTNEPLSAAVVDETIELIRRERDLAALGLL